MIDCIHWKSNHTTWAGGGECTAGVYHHPSAGTCQGCSRRQPREGQAAEPAELIQAATPVPRRTSFGELWHLLHTDPTGSPGLIEFVRTRLPCGECVRHFDQYVQANPPTFGDGWFRWVWELHNAVNRRTGKPEITFEAGCERYGRTASTNSLYP